MTQRANQLNRHLRVRLYKKMGCKADGEDKTAATTRRISVVRSAQKRRLVG